MSRPDPADLPDVIEEIVPALLKGDWIRYAEGDSDRFYYIIREQDHAIEVERGIAFKHGVAFGTPETDLFWEWYLKAALAEEPSDRLAAARKRVIAEGVDKKVFDDAMEAFAAAETVQELRAVLEDWVDHFVEYQRLDALTTLMQAVRIVRLRQGHLFVSEAERPELRGAAESYFLGELSQRYRKAVERTTLFEWLSFSDPQLREASRCYLYGFTRATVLISVAALESRLRAFVAADRYSTFDVLADLAFGKAGVLGYDVRSAHALKDLFNLRNDIAHASADATPKEAEDALLLVRDVLERIAKHKHS